MLLSAITVFGLFAVSTARPNGVVPVNVVVVPPNCPPGQAWVNGQCRDVWRLAPSPILLPQPLIPAPAQNGDNAPWELMQTEVRTNEALPMEIEHKGMITVPNQCPIGFKPDALGICRKIF